MHTIWYERTGPAAQVLTFGEMETPQPGPGEVLVRVRTSGVNPSDTKKRSGSQPMVYPRIIPHSDGAGIIEAAGSSVPISRIGERVWTWNAQFGRPFGTAAEYVALPAIQAVRLPDAADMAAGACLGIPALTAHSCLFADGPVRGLSVLVTGGAGTVGNAAIQLAKWGGATVIATVSSPEKADAARAAGADHVINYRSEDVAARVKELTHGAGVDRIVDVSFGQNLPVSSAVIKQNGVIAALAAGALQPMIAKRFPLRETFQAHQAVESGQAIGNIVVEAD